MESHDVTRREVLIGATSATLLLATRPSWAALLNTKENKMSEPKLVSVPQAIPEKVYTSEKVGISRKTHDEHLKLWQGYANQTNNLRKAMAALDTDPAKANQIISPTRSLTDTAPRASSRLKEFEHFRAHS